MKPVVGDLLHVHATRVGAKDRLGEIVAMRGTEGDPPYLVRFDDGHLGLVFPGPGAVVEHEGVRTAFGDGA